MGSFYYFLLARTSLKALHNLEQFSLCLFFFCSLRKRNKQGIKNCVDFYCLSPYLKDASKMKKEQIPWGLQYLFWAERAKLTFHVSRPHPLNKGASSLRLSCVSSTDYPYCYTVLNADGRVHTVTCVRLFYLFPCISFYTVSHMRIAFSHSLFLIVPFFIFYFYSAFSYRPNALYSIKLS